MSKEQMRFDIMLTKKISDNKYVSILFWVCWVAYFSTYFGRLNFNAIIIEMVSEGFITKSLAGLISTTAFSTYALGQFVSGFIAEKTSSKTMMFFSLLTSAIINILMVFSNSTVMIFLWGLNGFIQAMAWPPILKLFTERLQEKVRVKISVNFSTCSIMGSLGVYLMCAILINFLPWRSVFLSASLIMIISAIIWFWGISKVTNHTDENGIYEYKENSEITQNKSSFIKLCIVSGFIFIAISVIMHGALKDGVTTWVPTYISETFGVGSTASILSATVLPVINILGLYFASFLNNKIIKNEMITSGLLFIVSSISIILMIKIGHINIFISSALLALITSAMYGVNILTVGLVPLFFAKDGRAASATGVLNSFGYFGCAISIYGIGAISDLKGWGFVVYTWLIISVIGFISCLISAKQWKIFREDVSIF